MYTVLPSNALDYFWNLTVVNLKSTHYISSTSSLHLYNSRYQCNQSDGVHLYCLCLKGMIPGPSIRRSTFSRLNLNGFVNSTDTNISSLTLGEPVTCRETETQEREVKATSRGQQTHSDSTGRAFH